jgi:proline dehydrogenase
MAGETRKDAIVAVGRLNGEGIRATVDNLGENVKDASEARESVNEYLSLLDEIDRSKADSTISLKLTHLGLDVSEELAEKNAGTIIERARTLKNFVRFDMEGSAYTQKTIDMAVKLHRLYPNVGVAVQSYLKRSASDIDLLIKEGVSVRLVKGAYKEPREIAFENKSDVDRNYEALMKKLLLNGVRPAVATHDEKLINGAIKFAEDNNISKERFEFQMLLGIKRTLQKKLAKEGYTVRVYVPYGKNWLPYTLRRLGERKENFLFVVKNIFD